MRWLLCIPCCFALLAQQPSSCVRCHALLPGASGAPTAAFEQSVHARLGLDCVTCHGGDPGEEDAALSMSPERGFRGRIGPREAVALCGECHAAAASEFRKSVHWSALEQGHASAASCMSCHGAHDVRVPKAAEADQVCGSCHSRILDLHLQSPHGPAFAAMEISGCKTCHGSHQVRAASRLRLTGAQWVCGGCHDRGSAEARVAGRLASQLQALRVELREASEAIGSAERKGMAVSRARLRETEARQQLVKAGVAVHGFSIDAVEQEVRAGLEFVAAAHAMGESALREWNVRRIGLSISLAAIVLTIAGLWMAIRLMEKPEDGGDS